MITIIADGSYCPHYRCGGYSFVVIKDGTIIASQADTILQADSAYHCEGIAIHRALETVSALVSWKKITDGKIGVITDNQNIAARMRKENQFLRQVNYYRPDPWDKIHKLMIELNWIEFNPMWESFKKDTPGYYHHTMAKQMMLEARKQVISQVEQSHATNQTQ
jgi:hypothetical protein